MNSESQTETAVLLSNEEPDVDDRSIGSVGSVLSELNQRKQKEQRERPSRVRASTRHNIPIKERMKLLKNQDSKMSRDCAEAGSSRRARKLRATRRMKFEGRRSEESNEQLNHPKVRPSMRHNNPVKQRMRALKEENGKCSQEKLGAKMEKKKFRRVLFLESLDEEDDEETKKKREEKKLSRDRMLNVRSIRSRARDIRDFSRKSYDTLEEIREQKSEEVMREVTRKPMKLDAESKEDHKRRCEESIDETRTLMKSREACDAAKEVEKMSLENEEKLDEQIVEEVEKEEVEKEKVEKEEVCDAAKKIEKMSLENEEKLDEQIVEEVEKEEVCDEEEDSYEEKYSDDEIEDILSDEDIFSDEDLELTEDDLSYDSYSDVISDYSEEDELSDKKDSKDF